MYAASKTVVADSGEGPYKRGLNWPVELAGIAGAVILSIGILPPYPEIWKRRGRVIGISEYFRATPGIERMAYSSQIGFFCVWIRWGPFSHYWP